MTVGDAAAAAAAAACKARGSMSHSRQCSSDIAVSRIARTVFPGSEKLFSFDEREMEQNQRYPASLFTTEDLVRAMALVQVVLDSFFTENDDWSNVESQGRFARLIETQQSEELGSLGSYLKSLVRQYVSRIEASPDELEDEILLGLILHFSMSRDSMPPDPLE